MMTRCFDQHSYPFLQRVRKSDAPDYFDVISHPMDLGTMTKKLKKCEVRMHSLARSLLERSHAHCSVCAIQYWSTKAFLDDFKLIISNCRKYNTDPSSLYRLHASELEKKAKSLMRDVPMVDLSHLRYQADRTPLNNAYAVAHLLSSDTRFLL